MALFKNYATSIMTFLSRNSTLSHSVSFTISLPLCYSLKFTKKLQNERKEDFLHIRLLQRITLYQRRKKITSLDTIEFLDTHPCKKQSTLTKLHEKPSFPCHFLLLSSSTLRLFLFKTKTYKLVFGNCGSLIYC